MINVLKELIELREASKVISNSNWLSCDPPPIASPSPEYINAANQAAHSITLIANRMDEIEENIITARADPTNAYREDVYRWFLKMLRGEE